ncbi:MAG: EpsG family protein [Bacteroidales bacterium]|nr:EpsG family protein [Bacteroidales bacterium]
MTANKRFVIKTLIFIFFIFSFWGGDWFNYYEAIIEMKLYGSNFELLTGYESLELPYWYIARFVNYNYILFRIVVWGSIFILVFKTQKRLELDNNIFLISFVFISMLLLSYARVSLAMSLAFYGYSFIVKPKINSKLRSYILGLLFIISSLFFHKSAIFLLVIFPLSLFKLSKKTIFLSFMLFPVLIFIIKTTGFDYIMNKSIDDESIINLRSAQEYLNADDYQYGVGMYISNILLYSVFYFSFWIILRHVFSEKYCNMPKHVQKYTNAVFWIILFSSIFLFTGTISVFYYRLLYFSVIPLSFFVAYIMSQNIDFNLSRILIIVSIIWSFYMVSYSFYGSFF